MATTNQQEVFLFMPDISGFTRFINETEIEHSAHIIQELLEIIINANELDLKLLEIEGDAIFFFRLGKTPTAREIITQSKNIFEKFHQHLMKYESRRICECGACRTANNLTLKFVIHTGDVGSYYVNNQYKLIGKDVILLHRLMKNSIQENEYLLFTEPFFEELVPEKLDMQLFSFVDNSESFDSTEVPYKYLPIKNWLDNLELVEEADISDQPDLIAMIEETVDIDKPANIVFGYITDLSKRTEWTHGIKSIELESNEKINRSGTVHKCILDDKSTVVFETKFYDQQESYFSITELENKKQAFGSRFTVEGISENTAKVKIQFLVKNNLFQKIMFSMFMKNKMTKSIKKSLLNLQLKFKG